MRKMALGVRIFGATCRHIIPVKIVARNYLVSLALTTVVGLLVVWQQYRDRIRPLAWAVSESDRCVIEDRLKTSERRVRELENELAALRERLLVGSFDGGMGKDDPASGREPEGSAMVRHTHAREQPGLISPEEGRASKQRGHITQAKKLIDSYYSPLFAALKLPAEQADAFTSLLIDKQLTMEDLRRVASEQGVNLRSNAEYVGRLIDSTQRKLEDEIKSLLGPPGYLRYEHYQKTLPQREVTKRLRESLSYVGAAVTDAQIDHMNDVISSAIDSTFSVNRGFR